MVFIKIFYRLSPRQFQNQLPPELKKKCEENITFGNIFSSEVNGLIFSTEYGIITTISDSMRYFVEFMNLGLLFVSI